MEITNPAVDNPLGFPFTANPIAEKISPREHIIQPKTGNHPKKKATKAKIKPVFPKPFDLLTFLFDIIIVFFKFNKPNLPAAIFISQFTHTF